MFWCLKPKLNPNLESEPKKRCLQGTLLGLFSLIIPFVLGAVPRASAGLLTMIHVIPTNQSEAELGRENPSLYVKLKICMQCWLAVKKCEITLSTKHVCRVDSDVHFGKKKNSDTHFRGVLYLVLLRWINKWREISCVFFLF